VFHATPQRTPPTRHPLVRQTLGERAQRKAAVFGQERADQALAHRQRHEQQQQCAAEHHGPGHEHVAAEVAEPRDARAQEHQQRQQRQRAAEADAELARCELTEEDVQHLERPATRPDREPANEQPGQAEPGTGNERPALRAAGRHAPRRQRHAEPDEPDPQPRFAMHQRLHDAARRLAAAEDARHRLEQAEVLREVPGQQPIGGHAHQQPGPHDALRTCAAAVFRQRLDRQLRGHRRDLSAPGR
jgi:hypothetical protein